MSEACDFCTVDEACAVLNVSSDSVYRYVRTGKLKLLRDIDGRRVILRDDLEALRANRRKNDAAERVETIAYTVRAAALALNVSPSRVYQRIRSGELRSTIVWGTHFIDPADLRRLFTEAETRNVNVPAKLSALKAGRASKAARVSGDA
jgi:excisionase family DNA binding protein